MKCGPESTFLRVSLVCGFAILVILLGKDYDSNSRFGLYANSDDPKPYDSVREDSDNINLAWNTAWLSCFIECFRSLFATCISPLIMFYHNILIPLFVSTLSSFSLVEARSQAQYLSQAVRTVNALNRNFYNDTSALWQNLWWNSANAMTAIGNLGIADTSYKQSAQQQLSTIFKKARTEQEFLNGFYDDEGWWALGWITAFDLTSNTEYLAEAEKIFDDMSIGWNTSCEGGIWWDKAQTYIASISNELFFSVAAHLAKRVPEKREQYIDWAEREWNWFNAAGLINKDHNINDGVDNTTCRNNNLQVWTYNQGVILGGLVELNAVSPNSTYIDTANAIASAAIEKLSDNGILTEHGYPNGLDNNLAQFKGIFVRNLAILHKAAPNQNFSSFLQKNADSVWDQARNRTTGLVGPHWQGPVQVNSTAPEQSSALDCLIAAAIVSGN